MSPKLNKAAVKWIAVPIAVLFIGIPLVIWTKWRRRK
jgi:hypothetical protein